MPSPLLQLCRAAGMESLFSLHQHPGCTCLVRRGVPGRCRSCDGNDSIGAESSQIRRLLATIVRAKPPINPVLDGTDVDLVKIISLDPRSPFSRRGWEWLVMDGWLGGCWSLSRGDSVFGRSWAVVLQTNPFFLETYSLGHCEGWWGDFARGEGRPLS